MEQYIPKSALVAEIESYKNSFCDRNGYLEDIETNGLAYSTLCELEDSINTLEVKEVDLEKYYHEFLQKEWFGNSHVRTMSEMMAFTARHFFELGLKAQKGEKV